MESNLRGRNDCLLIRVSLVQILRSVSGVCADVPGCLLDEKDEACRVPLLPPHHSISRMD